MHYIIMHIVYYKLIFLYFLYHLSMIRDKKNTPHSDVFSSCFKSFSKTPSSAVWFLPNTSSFA